MMCKYVYLCTAIRSQFCTGMELYFSAMKKRSFQIFVNAKYEECIRVAALCIPAGLNTNMPSFRDILFFFKE
jgi:hypothetical protein